MIVSLSSVRGSPGVTSCSLLLAAAWPKEHTVDRIVVEADTDGGVAAARYGIGATPGVAQLLSSLRGGAEAPDDVSAFARCLGQHGWLVPGPETSESSAAIWSAPGSATNAAAALSRDRRLWLFDVGRAGPTTPLAPVLRSSSMVVVVSRGDHESIVQLPSRIEALRNDGCRLVVTGLTGRSSFPAREIGDFCDTAVVELPADPQLPQIAGAVWSSRRARRRPVWRGSVDAAAALAGLLVTEPTPDAATPEGSHAG